MRCEEARPLISAAIDHELEAGQAALLRRHLAECLACSTEYDMVASTVRLLHTVPEVEPPIELRRRIGAALWEAERSAQRRGWLPLWLARPRTAGWAWGAALGATAAAVMLVSTRGQAPTRRNAASHSPRSAAVASSSIQPHAVIASAKKLPSHPVQAEAAGRKLTHPVRASGPAVVALKPSVPAVMAPEAAAPPVAPAQEERHSIIGSPHGFARLSARVHHGARVGRVQTIGVHSSTPQHSVPHPAPSSRPQSSGDGSMQVATKAAPSLPPPASSTQSPDEDQAPDTNGMTHMAYSEPMSASSTEESDDLAALRQRLMDRPLQAPELGQLKPANGSGSSRDGWIRF